MQAYHYPGNIFIVTGPSGAGKSTLLERLIAEDPRLIFSVSHTTRPARQGEVHGKHYHFVDRDTFNTLIDEGAFLEYASVHGHLYGTSKPHLIEQLEQGMDLVLDVDVKGAAQVKMALPSACSIFILPPSFERLQARLVGRGKDSAEVIRTRLTNAAGEVRHALEFDFAVVNDDLETCYNQLKTVVMANRLRPFRQREMLHKILETFSAQAYN